MTTHLPRWTSAVLVPLSLVAFAACSGDGDDDKDTDAKTEKKSVSTKLDGATMTAEFSITGGEHEGDYKIETDYAYACSYALSADDKWEVVFTTEDGGEAITVDGDPVYGFGLEFIADPETGEIDGAEDREMGFRLLEDGIGEDIETYDADFTLTDDGSGPVDIAFSGQGNGATFEGTVNCLEVVRD